MPIVEKINSLLEEVLISNREQDEEVDLVANEVLIGSIENLEQTPPVPSIFISMKNTKSGINIEAHYDLNESNNVVKSIRQYQAELFHEKKDMLCEEGMVIEGIYIITATNIAHTMPDNQHVSIALSNIDTKQGLIYHMNKQQISQLITQLTEALHSMSE